MTWDHIIRRDCFRLRIVTSVRCSVVIRRAIATYNAGDVSKPKSNDALEQLMMRAASEKRMKERTRYFVRSLANNATPPPPPGVIVAAAGGAR